MPRLCYLSKNGEYSYKNFKQEERDAANKMFLEKKEEGVPIITHSKGKILFWNSTWEDWFIPIMMKEYDYWEEDAEASVLSHVHEMAQEKYGNDYYNMDEWELSFNGVNFTVESYFEHGDYHPRGKHETYVFVVNGEQMSTLSEVR